jgi:cellobiose phosphorylase
VHREFHRLFLRCRATEENGRTHLLFNKELDTRPGQKEHWNEPFPGVFCHTALSPVAGFETDRAAFYGYGGSDEAPEMLRKPPRRCEPGAWGDAMASLDLVFPDADRIETALVSAYAGSDDEAIALVEASAGIGRDAALEAIEDFWQTEIGALACETPSPELDAMASRWLRLQTIVGRLYGRCALYQASGAFGFRDQLQDSLIFLPYAPERAGAQLTLHLKHQFRNGEVLHWWHPGPETGPRTKCSDDFLWPILAAAERHRETGETKFLKERVPFLDGGEKPVWDHLRRSIDLAWARRSARGIPLLGECDWNDGLSSAGDEGRGESVWVGQFLHLLLIEMDRLAKVAGRKDEGFLERAAELRRIINEHAWDGAWYIQGTNDSGAPIGSSRCAEGKIHLNPQTWSVIAQIAAEEPVLDGPVRWTERARQAMASVKERLVVDWGVLLLAPAYQTPDPSIGYITRYAPGRRENGGVYTHAAVWTAKAARLLGDAELVRQVVFSLLPPVRGKDPRYVAEPYVTPGNIDGPITPTPGRGGWTWYTGSSAWLNRTIFEDLLGVRPQPDGLIFEPMVPADWNGFRVTRPWRGKLLSIEMVRGNEPGIRIRSAAKGRSKEIAGKILSWKDLPARATEIELEVVFA